MSERDDPQRVFANAVDHALRKAADRRPAQIRSDTFGPIGIEFDSPQCRLDLVPQNPAETDTLSLVEPNGRLDFGIRLERKLDDHCHWCFARSS